MYRSLRIPYSEIPQLSDKDRTYITGDARWSNFQKYKPSIHSFKEVIEDKKKQPVDRQTLYKVLKKQYAELKTNDLVSSNIELLLNERTFTVVTAHQPALFTGPLYYVYKIISTINLAENLKSFYPDYDFVPLFISGSEDHDFDEVNHLNLFGKKISWTSNQTGSVGMMSNQGVLSVLSELDQILKNDNILSLLKDLYPESGNYGKSARSLVNHLFSRFGLVVLDMNDADLKSLFKDILVQELFDRPSQKLVTATQNELNKVGFASQAFVRPINLFYLQEGRRDRIEVKEDGSFQILNTRIVFTEEEMRKEILDYPERFSPNVVLRPIYQELILPNLAYVGGGGEIAYWLERKTQFEYFGVNFPVLIRRNSVLIIDQNTKSRIDKLGFHILDLFKEADLLAREYIDRNSKIELNLSQEIGELAILFDRIAQKVVLADKSLEKTALAEKVKNLKSAEFLEERMIKAEKQKHEISIQQIQKLKLKLFPENGLQERYDNFLGYYSESGDSFFDMLKSNLNPFEEGFVVLIDS
jgi:bacillithiol synthase